jgi:hypothetical protein
VLLDTLPSILEMKKDGFLIWSGINMYGVLFELSGTMAPATSWQINNIVLPFGPASVKIGGGINKEIMSKSGDEPVQIIDGLSGTTLTLNGTIDDDSKTDTQLWTDILTPLLELRGTEVTLVCPYVGLNGSYLLDSFEPARDSFYPIYSYSLRLSKSSLVVVMQSED